MSVCNVWTRGDQAIIAVDTACLSSPDRIPGEFSKIHAIAHLGLAIAFRGEKLVALSAVTGIHGALDLVGFDDLVERFPSFIAAGVAALASKPKPAGVDLTTELFLVGWSESRERMAAACYLYQPGQPLEITDPDHLGAQLSPCRTQDETQWGLRLPLDSKDFDADLRTLFASQIAFGRETHPDTAFGGRLLIADMSRYAIKIVDLGELDG